MGGDKLFLEPLSILSQGYQRWPHVWFELLAEFLDIGAETAQSHTPPKYGARNSHISQMILEGQYGYQTVRLVLLINLIYLYMGL